MSSKLKICHLTSAHDRFDVRIFHKQCVSLAKTGYEVTLVVADGKGSEESEKIKIFDVGKSFSRLQRMIYVALKVFFKAIELDSEVYHLHDPELMPVGLFLRAIGKKVIFDAHEDLPLQILSKPYLGSFQAKLMANFFRFFEKISCRYFDSIVTATPHIRSKFLKINKKTTAINNFPLNGEISYSLLPDARRNEICYAGVIDKIRGIEELVDALNLTTCKAKLNLVGGFSDKNTLIELRTKPGWKYVNEIGFVARDSVKEFMRHSFAGIVNFHPLPNHIDAQPNKMFEYMAAGLPVIASHFPLWREIVEGYGCGICVNPQSPVEIAAAIDYLSMRPQLVQKMGENGQKAVREKFNWSAEEKKLLGVYKSIGHHNAYF